MVLSADLPAFLYNLYISLGTLLFINKEIKKISLTQVLYIQLKSSVIPGHGTDLGSWPCAEVSGL